MLQSAVYAPDGIVSVGQVLNSKVVAVASGKHKAHEERAG